MEESGRRTISPSPPADDCCPICFGTFSAPFQAPCAHWYCGACIIEYWNHVAAFKPCNCPMCSRPITKLTPESTLYHQQQHDQRVRELLNSVKQYNCLFVGGASATSSTALVCQETDSSNDGS